MFAVAKRLVDVNAQVFLELTYTVNITGPSIDPWGTRKFTGYLS